VHSDHELHAVIPAAPPPLFSIISGPIFATSVHVIGPGGWNAPGNNEFDYKTGLPDRDPGSIARAGNGGGGVLV
jgi:hypothetical protein